MPLNYNKTVMKEFMNPKNMGEIKNPDGVGEVGNPRCGDIMKVFIKVGKDKRGKEIIKDIKFKTFGCAAAIATSSMITQVAKGKTFDDAKKIKYKDVVESLGGLPPIKIHCSQLATEALNKAIADYKKHKDKKNDK
ncbi:MAG: iron-sulfur cluster assembly scaffold protein [Candidatus Pacearchaeota archaeon]|nr:iron-sulfur cluster assembly scaffold protein [Candidatus Pacearchaeota archaeon]